MVATDTNGLVASKSGSKGESRGVMRSKKRSFEVRETLI